MAGILFLGGNFKTNYLMKTIHLFFTLLLVAFHSINAQNKLVTIDHTQEHIQFLEDFYGEYLAGSGLPGPETQMIIFRKYCTSNLTNKIIKMWKNHELDYDPFVFAQDVPSIILDYLKVEKYGKEKNMYEVSYHYLNEDDSERTRIRLEVTNTPDGCKISNIISNYDKEKGLHFPLGRQ